MWPKIKSVLLENKTVRQVVAKNTFWLSVSDFGGRLLRAVIIIYAARVLGTAEWGVFSYAISIVTFLTVFTDFGISPLYLRERVKTQGDAKAKKELLSTSFFLKLALILLGAGVVLFLGPYITPIDGARSLLSIALFIFAFDSVRMFGFWIFRALEKMEWEAVLYFFTNACIVAFGFLFLKFQVSAASFTFAYALGTGAGMLATIYFLGKELRGIFSNFSFKVLKLILSSGWPLAISSFLGVLMINTDILLIGWFMTESDVGEYSAAHRIVQLLYLVPAIVSASMLPIISRLANKDDERLKRILEKVLAVTFIAAIPIAVGGIFLAPQIIRFLFGEEYVGATSAFRVLLVTILVDFPSVILSNIAFAYNKQKSLVTYSALGGATNVILDLFLIPRFGILGSAWATLIAQFVSNVYLRNVVRKVNYPHVIAHLERAILAVTAMVICLAILSFLHAHVLVSVFVGAAVYCGTLLLSREPLYEEIKSIFTGR